MTGWFTSGCAYVHDCHSNTPLMYTPTHTCLHVFKVQVQQNDLTNIQRVKQTTQRARLVISCAWQTTGKRAVMKCGCRVKWWDCINEYGHKTSCHREFELVRDRFGQGQKVSHSHIVSSPCLTPTHVDKMAHNEYEGTQKDSFTGYKGNKRCCVTLGMACFFCTGDPRSRTRVPQFTGTVGKKKARSGSSISFFPCFRLMLCRAQWELQKGGAAVHNSRSQALRDNTWNSSWQAYRQGICTNKKHYTFT